MISLNRIVRKFDHMLHPSKGVVLMLHRVTNDRSQLKQNRQIEITPAFLEKTILQYQSSGHVFVSMDAVAEMLRNQSFPSKPFVCVTFDDGYKDNLTVAAPIFRKYNVPYCIYVTTSFIDNSAILWWYVLEDIINSNSFIRLSDGRSFNCATLEEKNQTFQVLHDMIIFADTPSIRTYFEILFRAYDFDFEKKATELTLNIRDLKDLSKDSLCTIGAHTVSHPNLSLLSPTQKQTEIYTCKKLLSMWSGQEVVHFSYPYGIYDEECMSIVSNCHYFSSAIAYGGAVRSNSQLMALPRVSLEEV